MSGGGPMLREPLKVVAQDSFGLEGFTTAADMWPLPGVVQLVDAEK